MSQPGVFPEGFSVDAVDWLPSGARSGLVRVRGHRPPALSGPLPELILEAGGETRRYVSLPDPRADRDPTAWRGAYVLDARPAAEADKLWLEWPGQRRIQLPPLNVPAHQVERAEGEPTPEEDGGELVDHSVLAERRARRAEAAEQAQARIAREALRAVEVLELRSGELEERIAGAEAERDALREQAGAAAEGPDVRIEVMQAELRELRAALAQRPARVSDGPGPIAPGEGERRAERLRTALTATVATVAELRLRLHEADVARRTRDVGRAADAVRLSVLERERHALQTEMEQARSGLGEARRSRDEAAAEAAGIRAAHEDVVARQRETAAELGAARERVAELETELAAVAAEADRAAANARDAARAEATLSELETRLHRAEAALAEAETARELAEASALAATAERRAAEVAHAAGDARPAPRALSRAITPPTAQPAPASAPEVPLLAAAAEQERRAEEVRAPDESLLADLDAAREQLRESTGPTIISAPSEPPADLARGRGGRAYPPLRGALVKLAHDDPQAAAQLLAGLVHAQHAVVPDAPDYDLTIAEAGTFAVSRAGLTTLVSPLDVPRGRPHAAFHIESDALTFAELIAGVDRRLKRRRGPLRVSGKTRQARKLTDDLRDDTSLAELVRAGAELDPLLVLRAFGYAIRPAWTSGQTWAVELHVDGRPLTVAARHSGGLTVTDGPHESEPDARLHLSAEAFRGLVAGDDPSLRQEGDEAIVRRLLSLAGRARSGAE